MIDQKFTFYIPWARYSKKLAHKIEYPRHGGYFSYEEAKERGMRLVVGQCGQVEDGSCVALYLLVDEQDGIIADAKFQAFGPSALIGAAEITCERLIRKNYDQARRMTADLIDKHIRDQPGIGAFPEETWTYLNLLLEAIEQATKQCFDIPFAEHPLSTPVEVKREAGPGYPGWAQLDHQQKIAVIEEVIATQIRPFIELDAGGIQVVDLINDRELRIAYQGTCTSCYSATGATLHAIQEILRSQVDAHLIVIPDTSFLV